MRWETSVFILPWNTAIMILGYIHAYNILSFLSISVRDSMENILSSCISISSTIWSIWGLTGPGISFHRPPSPQTWSSQACGLFCNHLHIFIAHWSPYTQHIHPMKINISTADKSKITLSLSISSVWVVYEFQMSLWDILHYNVHVTSVKDFHVFN